MMKNIMIALFCTSLALAPGLQAAGSVSEKRIGALEKMFADEAEAQGNNATVSSLVEAVRPRFVALDDGLKAGCVKPVVRESESERAAHDELNAALDKAYPALTPQQLRRKAEEARPLYKRGDMVRIRYRFNPKSSRVATGIFREVKAGYIMINTGDRVRMGDMEGIPGNDGPEGELAKYDVQLNRKYRQEWMEQYSVEMTEGRRKFEAENSEKFIARRKEADHAANEANGYTWYKFMWYSQDDLLREFAERALGVMERRNAEAAEKVVAERREKLASQTKIGAIQAVYAPYGSFPSAQQELARQAAEEQARRDAMAQRRREEQLKLEREREEARQLAEREAREAELAKKAKIKRLTAELEETGQHDYVLYGLIAFGLLAVAGAYGWWYHRKREEERNLAVERFFAGKGKVQQEFWDAAEADPDHFKYVAYIFNDTDSARDALGHLSFISMDPDGQLHCRRNDIRFGTYEHQGRAVAFIGGDKLNYARWREASMVWPELPSASYFRQSTEPVVSLELPKLEDMKGEIENLGSEDVKLENGEINRVFRFKTASREKALDFLGKFKIEEEGIVVRVLTDHDGEFGKDINGTFAV